MKNLSISKPGYHGIKLGLLITTIAVLVLVALTSFWLRYTMFDTDNFTKLTTSAVHTPSSRRSIGELVANRVFERTPALRALLSDRLAERVAGVLETDRAQSSVNRAVRESQLLVTSPRRDPVTLDLTGFKSVIVTSQDLTNRTGDNARIDVNNIPDSVTIIDTTGWPNVHNYAMLFNWLGPISLLMAAILAGNWIMRGGKRLLLQRVQIIIASVAAGAMLAIILGPIVEPSFIALGRDAPSQTLMRNLYEAFMSPFYRVSITICSAGIFSIVVIGVWRWFNDRYRIAYSIQKKRAV